MSAWLRRAGRGRDATGALVIWSVAEGRRGRRWREVRVLDGAIASSLLFETDRRGRFSHTELSSPAGLLTLHPEGDGTIHGNLVTADGVAHVVGLPWQEDGFVLIDDSSIARAAGAHERGRAGGRAGERETLVLRVSLDLACRVERAALDALDLAATPGGLPILSDAAEWPLEQEGEGMPPGA